MIGSVQQSSSLYCWNNASKIYWIREVLDRDDRRPGQVRKGAAAANRSGSAPTRNHEKDVSCCPSLRVALLP